MPGDALLDLAGAATRDLLLVAPYIKVSALGRVLDACPSDVPITVVTRWKPEELALGVSDISVWPLLKARRAKLFLHPRLHAKYYASGDTVLIGSANLTHAALGWAPNANLEILTEVGRDQFATFEEVLSAALVAVDDALYDLFLFKLAAFPSTQAEFTLPPPEAPTELFELWRPALRHPQDLYEAYSGEAERLTTASRQAAAADLAVLEISPGLNQAQFNGAVSLMLRQHPEVIAIDALADEPQRFGVFRTLLSQRGAADGGLAWQAWMRWLLHFSPETYRMREANYSEIFGRVPNLQQGGGGTDAAPLRQVRD